MKPKIIHIPKERPARCCECPLLGTIPKSMLDEGERYTMWCFLAGHERAISGRGAKAFDVRHRNSCRPADYNLVFARNNGDIEVSWEDWRNYGLDRTSWLLERDRRLSNETEETIPG